MSMQPRTKKRTRTAVAVTAAVAALTGALPSHGAISSVTVTRGAAIIPPDDVSASAPGVAARLRVKGKPGRIVDVNVRLRGLSAQFMDEAEIALYGPNGKAVVLLSDRCPNWHATSSTWTIDDEAPIELGSDLTQCGPGRYRASDWDEGDGADAIVPVNHADALSVFDGISPNGTWVLRVADDSAGYPVTLDRGFSLTFRLKR